MQGMTKSLSELFAMFKTAEVEIKEHNMLLVNKTTDFKKFGKSTDEGMTPRVLDIGLPTTAQEQDGHSKPKKPKTN
jgi:hypothetical protein